MSDTERYVRITGDAERPVEKLINDLKKAAADAGRYGHEINVEVVNKSELQETDGFGD